jgi:hypothetical protein
MASTSAEMQEKLDEKHEEGPASPTGTADSSIDSDIPLPAFEPISTAPSKAASRNSYQRSISRTRSNNGYGVDDIEDDIEEGTVGAAPVEKDSFEVRWEGGDDDPGCPRSMSHAKKWVVVIIVSASSLCV